MTHPLETELPGFTPSPLQQAAIDRIEYFQKKLKEDYGLYARTAIELEFYVQDKNGTPVMCAIELEKAGDYLRQHAPNHFERLSLENAFEYISPRSKAQYEVTVIDPVNKIPGSKARDYAPVDVARAALGMRERVLKDMLMNSSCLTQPAPLEPNFAARPYPHLTEIGGIIEPHLQTSALHVNISLADAGGQNLFARSNRLINHCAEALVQLHREAALTVMPNENSVTRISINDSAPRTMGTMFGNALHTNPASVSIRKYDPGSEFREHTRLENRLPGADADPFVAMAVTLAAVYEAVQKNVTRKDERTLHIEPKKDPSTMRTLLFDQDAPPEEKHQALVRKFTDPVARDHLRGLFGAKLYDAVLNEYGRTEALSV